MNALQHNLNLGPFWLDPCARTDLFGATAANHIQAGDGGLSAKWEGRVFLNLDLVPDSGHAQAWLDKFIAHGSGVCVCRGQSPVIFSKQNKH